MLFPFELRALVTERSVTDYRGSFRNRKPLQVEATPVKNGAAWRSPAESNQPLTYWQTACGAANPFRKVYQPFTEVEGWIRANHG